MRIRVRDLTIHDLDTMNKWHNNKSLFEFLVGNFYGPTLEETRKWILEYQRNKKTFRGIVSNEEGRDIGAIYLIHKNDSNEAELGIFIAEKTDRHKGYGKEMFIWMLNFGFNVLKLDKIFLYALENNTTAISLYKTFNFISNSAFSIRVIKNNKEATAVYMQLDKETYYEKNS